MISFRNAARGIAIMLAVAAPAASSAPPWFNLIDRGAGQCFMQGMGQGASPGEAEADAWGNVLASLGAERIDTLQTLIFDLQKRTATGRADEGRIESRASARVALDGHGLEIAAQEWERCGAGRYRHYLLLCRGPAGGCSIEYPSDAAARVRACLVPGWGHFYKKRPGHGLFFLGCFGASAGGAFLALGLAGAYRDDALGARTAGARAEYARRHDTAMMTAAALAVLGSTIWVWNVFDAGTRRGVPRLGCNEP